MSFRIRGFAAGAIGGLASCGRIGLGLLLISAALPPTARGASEPPNYRIDDWQAEQGLPQSSVTSIVQTRDGYLWLGTFNGLARFDGVQFRIFNPNNSPGLTSSRIVQLFEDRRGALWISTEDGTLVRHAAGKFEAFDLPALVGTSGYVHTFAETGDGSLWIMTSGQQVAKFSNGRFASVTCHWDLEGTQPGGMAVDSHGRLWISTGKAISSWQGNQFQDVLEQNLKASSSSAILASSRLGGFWTAQSGRIRRFDEGHWAADFGSYPWSRGDLYSMREDRNGRLWAGTYGSGLYCYATNGSVTHFSAKEGLPGDFVRSLCEDREGNFWVGLEGCGLARLKPAIFRSYGRQQGLSGDCVLSVCEGADGEIWVGTNGDGVDRLKNGIIRHFGLAEGLSNEFVWSLFEDRNKTLWAGTWGGGLFRLKAKTFVPVANTGGPGTVVCALYEDAAGSLWVGEQRSSSEVLELRGGEPVLRRLDGRLPNADVRAVTEDKSGNLWIGTADGGLYKIHGGEQRHYGLRDGLSGASIRSLYADRDGVLWVGTYGGGLGRVEDDRVTNFTTKNGLANDALGFITEDNRGNLWCGSLGGVFRVARAELNRVARGQGQSIVCDGYTTADGLPSLECCGGNQPSGCKGRDGRLWFPTIHGLAVVDPENVAVNPLPPPVIIEEVVLDGKSGSVTWSADEPGHWLASAGLGAKGAALTVPAGNQRFEFRYTGLSLTAPKKVRFEYKLGGLEEDWVDAGPRRAANYSHLRPGPYRFSVRACNNDGVWNETGASLAFVILPYFWQTWWFRAAGAAAIILLFVAIYEMRLASQRRLARLRLRIARDLHDEVGSNLGSIALLSEVMPKTSPDGLDEASEIRRIAVQTIGSLRDIVWFLDPASDNMEDLVLRMKDTAKTMLPGIAFNFVSQGETTPVSPSLELRRNVFPMFKETLHNVAKHAHTTRVEIMVQIAPRQFQFEVRDNGVGFDEANVRPGNGLKNLRRRAADLGGTLEIRSQPGNGARVTLTVPIP